MITSKLFFSITFLIERGWGSSSGVVVVVKRAKKVKKKKKIREVFLRKNSKKTRE